MRTIRSPDTLDRARRHLNVMSASRRNRLGHIALIAIVPLVVGGCMWPVDPVPTFPSRSSTPLPI
jgi:hypothetical protein